MNDSTSRISPAWPTRWPPGSFSSVWTWLLAAFVAGLFLLAFVAGVSLPQPRSVEPKLLDAAILLQFFFEGLLVAVVLSALPRLSKFRLSELGFRPVGMATLGIAVAGAIAMGIVSDGSAALVERIAHTAHHQESVEIFKHLHDRTTIAVFAFAAIVAAPIAEESIFRAFFFNLGLRYGGFWGGALLSSVLFGLAHGDLYEAIPLALGGAVLCGVYYTSRNAFASMISHGLFNAFTIFALLLSPSLTS